MSRPRPRAQITAVAGHVPEGILSNQDLEGMVQTNDEWIVSRTGIRERRILREPGAGVSRLLVPAAQGVIDKSGIDPDSIEAIVCATTTPDLVFPATANIVAHQIGAGKAYGYDVQAACSGFLFALSTATMMIESGRHRRVLVLGGDKMSSIVDYEDRTTCIIFGDGAGAALLEAAPEDDECVVEDFLLRSDGAGEPYLHMKAGGSREPASIESVMGRRHVVYQEGSTVFKFAVTQMADVSAELLARHGLTGADIDWLVPHQANRRIIDAAAARLSLPDSKVMRNIERYGNTTNGTLPLCLSDYESQLRRGDRLVLAAFGGGFTWGALLLRWAYDPS